MTRTKLSSEDSGRQSGELEVSGFVCDHVTTASVKTPPVLKLNINSLIADGQRSDVERSVCKVPLI